MFNSSYKITAKEFAEYDRGGIWADKAYKVKPTKWSNLGLYCSKSDKVNIIFKEAESKKSIPAPNAYIKAWNWKE